MHPDIISLWIRVSLPIFFSQNNRSKWLRRHQILCRFVRLYKGYRPIFFRLSQSSKWKWCPICTGGDLLLLWSHQSQADDKCLSAEMRFFTLQGGGFDQRWGRLSRSLCCQISGCARTAWKGASFLDILDYSSVPGLDKYDPTRRQANSADSTATKEIGSLVSYHCCYNTVNKHYYVTFELHRLNYKTFYFVQ